MAAVKQPKSFDYGQPNPRPPGGKLGKPSSLPDLSPTQWPSTGSAPLPEPASSPMRPPQALGRPHPKGHPPGQLGK